MKLSLSSLVHRMQAPFRKPDVAVVVSQPVRREVDPVAQAYRQYGPRVARHVARASRAKEPSTDGSPRLTLF